MDRGPLPQTDEERKAKGNPGHRKTRAVRVPMPPPLERGGRIADHPPKQLNSAQRRIWQTVAPTIEHLNLLQTPDMPAFARYCQWLYRFHELEQATRGEDMVITTTSAHVTMDRLDKRFHAMTIIDKRLLDYEDRFGMNPRERQSILMKLVLNAQGAGAVPAAQGGLNLPRGGEAASDGQPGGAGRASAIGILQRPH